MSRLQKNENFKQNCKMIHSFWRQLNRGVSKNERRERMTHHSRGCCTWYKNECEVMHPKHEREFFFILLQAFFHLQFNVILFLFFFVLQSWFFFCYFISFSDLLFQFHRLIRRITSRRAPNYFERFSESKNICVISIHFPSIFPPFFFICTINWFI